MSLGSGRSKSAIESVRKNGRTISQQLQNAVAAYQQ